MTYRLAPGDRSFESTRENLERKNKRVDEAHRSPKPAQEAKPRAIIVRLHNYKLQELAG